MEDSSISNSLFVIHYNNCSRLIHHICMHTFSEISVRFESFLKQQHFPSEPNNLYEPCRYLLDAGGKRIRPALCLMAQELFSDLKEEAFHAATALELFHNFTLIHDDIMDAAPLRRGMSTIHVKYGQTTGILSGDVMSIYAYRQMEYLKPENLIAVFSIFNQMAVQVCEGQQWDFEFESIEEVSVDQYLKMIELKTSVLIAASLQIGALIGGAMPIQAEALYDFGKYMGIAFQLQDDYLDVFGFSQQTGKQPGGDIIASKKTILYTYYQSVADYNESKILREIYMQNERDKVQQVTQIWKDSGVDVQVMEMVKGYTEKAFERLRLVGLTEDKTKELSALFLQLMTRKS